MYDPEHLPTIFLHYELRVEKKNHFEKVVLSVTINGKTPQIMADVQQS